MLDIKNKNPLRHLICWASWDNSYFCMWCNLPIQKTDKETCPQRLLKHAGFIDHPKEIKYQYYAEYLEKKGVL